LASNSPITAKMARKKPGLKAAWVLLFVCLLIGGRISAARAGDSTGVQLVLVLDLSSSPDYSQAPDRVSQAAALLVHLLPDQDYLGLAAPGVELTAAELNPEKRRQVLKTLATLKPTLQPKPFADIVAQSLNLFQPGGPEKRGLFILSDGAGTAEPEKEPAHLQEIAKLAAQARKAGVAIFAASQVSGFSSDEIKALTLATGGRYWYAKTAPDLITAILNFYERLGQHQEVPITGTYFRLNPWVKQAVVVALRAVPGKAVVLTTPTGARLTPRTRAKTISWVSGQDYDLVTLSASRPGVWSLAGARPADSRVFLDTELTLTGTGTPRVAGADEALPVTAALSGPERALAGAQGLAGTEFLAQIQMSYGAPLTVKLEAPEPGNTSAHSPGVRVGRFPPRHQEGDAALRITALGKTFSRSVELPITISRPWYRVTLPTAAAPKAPPISFQPDVKHHPQKVEGTVTVQSGQGSLAGVLINPVPGSEIVIDQLPDCQDSCLADLQLTGMAPGGRHLVIASGPRRLTIPPETLEKNAAPATEKVYQEKAPASHTPAGTRKSKRRWFWLALSGIGIVFFLGAGVLFWLEGRGDQDAEGDEDPGDTSGKSVLRLQAQVDGLLKEKAQLQAALEEKKRQTEHLEKENADLQGELERAKTKSQGSSKNLEELEKRLEDAEREAKGFQQEYMALYARSQEEKNTIKKN
jgi:hypothetical protein